MADLALDQIAEGKPVRIEKDGKAICVARVGDEVFAVADTCTHSDASNNCAGQLPAGPSCALEKANHTLHDTPQAKSLTGVHPLLAPQNRTRTAPAAAAAAAAAPAHRERRNRRR